MHLKLLTIESLQNYFLKLLAGQKKQPSFWTFEYYQKFFDVDTKQVLLSKSLDVNPFI